MVRSYVVAFAFLICSVGLATTNETLTEDFQTYLDQVQIIQHTYKSLFDSPSNCGVLTSDGGQYQTLKNLIDLNQITGGRFRDDWNNWLTQFVWHHPLWYFQHMTECEYPASHISRIRLALKNWIVTADNLLTAYCAIHSADIQSALAKLDESSSLILTKAHDVKTNLHECLVEPHETR